ncbi:MAG: macro domain-containing protein [Nitrospiraceae bacterium]|nr:macro domain-containing protein [Nitrospiraceae bacterium]
MKIVARYSENGKTLRVVEDDITGRDVDCIVNAANSRLQHGGGVAGAIVRKGGRVIQEESNAIGYVPVGHAALTGAGRLPARAVIHAVGPRMGEGDEDQKLESAVLSSLELASLKSFKSISMPAISSGIFGFPKKRCAEILVRTALRFIRENPQTSLETVEFCLFDSVTSGYFQAEVQKLGGSSA